MIPQSLWLRTPKAATSSLFSALPLVLKYDAYGRHQFALRLEKAPRSSNLEHAAYWCLLLFPALLSLTSCRLKCKLATKLIV